MADLPVACTLSPAALQARREDLLNAVLRRTKERRELPNGYSLRFAAEGDVLAEIARTVDNVRIPAHREHPFRSNVNTDSDRW